MSNLEVNGSDTICAPATPHGPGAVGMVRVSGPDAARLLAAACGHRLPKPRRLVRRDLVDPASGQWIDRAMVCLLPGPRSYTGEDVVEVYGHGGVLNMQALVGLFVRLGARPAEPGEFTRRAFVNGRLDLTQAEAVGAVIAARSERALQNAQALLQGELGRRVRALRQQTVELAADLEACIDFAGELDAPVAAEQLMASHRELVDSIEQLADTYRQGRRLDGIAAALVGPVNSGKSSLFNALLDSRRALVSPEPGTTRDYLEAELSWDGLRVTLVDTAGLRPQAQMSALESAGHALGNERVESCDVLVRVVDFADAHGLHVAAWEKRRSDTLEIIAAHKVDLLDHAEVQARAEQLGVQSGLPVVQTSVVTRQGLEALRQQVVRCVLGTAADASGERPETVQVTQHRQWVALQRAGDALRAGLRQLRAGAAPELVVEHSRAALTSLGEIIGEGFTEDVLDAIFARFCIGK